MDYQLAVQEAVGLRTQPKLHFGIAATVKTADSAGGDRRPEQAARVHRAPTHRAADRAAAARVRRVWSAGIGEYFESLRIEILAVQIKINRVGTREERAAARVADASAERHRLHTGRDGLIIVDRAQGAAVRPDIRRIDAVLAGLEFVEPVLELDLPADEQHLRYRERAGRAGQRGPGLGGVEKVDAAELQGLGAALIDHRELARFFVALALRLLCLRRSRRLARGRRVPRAHVLADDEAFLREHLVVRVERHF